MHLIELQTNPGLHHVSQGRIVLATGEDGFITLEPDQGLFVQETRCLSRYRYSISGGPLQPICLSNIEQHSWLGYYIHRPPESPAELDMGSGRLQPASQQTIELRLCRFVGEAVHEDVDLHNFTQQSVSLELKLELGADFACLEETRSPRKQRGTIRQTWHTGGSPGTQVLRFDYEAEHSYEHQGDRGTASFRRSLILRIKSPMPPTFISSREPSDAQSPGAGTLRFLIDLPAHGRWHASIDLISEQPGASPKAPAKAHSFSSGPDGRDQLKQVFLAEATSFSSAESNTLAHVVIEALKRAKHDLAALRLYDLYHGPHAWLPAAGLPIYVALFGRDTLISAWQAGLLTPELLRGTLLELPRWQGTANDDWRDEQPGRMLHEAHTGPLELLNYNPRQRYYGGVTSSSLYSVVLGHLWRWTGDEALIRPLIEPALRAIQWLDRDTDLNGDGFYAYKSRSTMGCKNQGWRDSGDAIVYDDGTQVQPPIALCEEQCAVYAGKLSLSEVLWWLGDRELSRRLYQEAAALKQRFQEAFLLPAEDYVALGLDSNRRPIRSIGSQGCECLWAGILDDAQAGMIAQRLTADDLFTGWGIRTLSSSHPAYDPYSYHRGSVWPFQHGGCALGLVQYGLRAQAELLCRAQFEASALFKYHRLPEVFSGHPRDSHHPFPAIYPRANAPQAWSASVVFSFVQALLGLTPYAPLQLLLLDPELPTWLPEITLHDLHVGSATVTLRFSRTKEGSTNHQVLDQRGPLRIRRQPGHESLWTRFAKQQSDMLRDWAGSVGRP